MEPLPHPLWHAHVAHTHPESSDAHCSEYIKNCAVCRQRWRDPLGWQSRGINQFERICLYSWHFQIYCRGGSAYPLGASSGHLYPVWWCPSWWQSPLLMSGSLSFLLLAFSFAKSTRSEKDLFCVEEVETLQRCDWRIKNMDGTWTPRIFWVIVTLCWWNIISTYPFKLRAPRDSITTL